MVCALLLGISARCFESLGPLPLLLLGPVTAIWFLVLVGSSLRSAFRYRSHLPTAAGCLLTPVLAVIAFVLTLGAVWRTWGVLPIPVDKTTDFQIDQTLSSPDGAWKAVQVEDLSGGPATGTSTDVYLTRQRPGSALFFKDRVFSLECVQDFQIRWIGDRTLQISYSVGDAPPIDGLQPSTPLPIFHNQQDEWRVMDPVKVVEARHVIHGNLC